MENVLQKYKIVRIFFTYKIAKPGDYDGQGNQLASDNYTFTPDTRFGVQGILVDHKRNRDLNARFIPWTSIQQVEYAKE